VATSEFLPDSRHGELRIGKHHPNLAFGGATTRAPKSSRESGALPRGFPMNIAWQLLSLTNGTRQAHRNPPDPTRRFSAGPV